MLQRMNNQCGSSLIDVVLTTLVLGTALFGGILAMQTVTAHSVNGDLNSIAVQFANEKIEAIMADAEYKGYEAVVDANYSSENIPDHYNMTRSVGIVEVSESDLSTPAAGSGLKKIDVTVTWGVGEYQTVTLTTMVAE